MGKRDQPGRANRAAAVWTQVCGGEHEQRILPSGGRMGHVSTMKSFVEQRRAVGRARMVEISAEPAGIGGVTANRGNLASPDMAATTVRANTSRMHGSRQHRAACVTTRRVRRRCAGAIGTVTDPTAGMALPGGWRERETVGREARLGARYGRGEGRGVRARHGRGEAGLGGRGGGKHQTARGRVPDYAESHTGDSETREISRR